MTMDQQREWLIAKRHFPIVSSNCMVQILLYRSCTPCYARMRTNEGARCTEGSSIRARAANKCYLNLTLLQFLYKTFQQDVYRLLFQFQGSAEPAM